ncbi:MAG: hypothetical protein AWU57_1311 [Marinobacter sp. T13-3]|mgnify:CR=1 FL=1|nr:MAG: hypothetical protein AWU57_1311 [Marinobacter sp. T13-3]
MTDTHNAGIRLAYWADVFTILSVELLPKRFRGMKVWRLVLYCKGRHAVAALHELRVPTDWAPQPGEKIHAALKMGSGKGAKHLHIQFIDPA